MFDAYRVHEICPETHTAKERFDTEAVTPAHDIYMPRGEHEAFYCAGIRLLDVIVNAHIVDGDGFTPVNYLVSEYTVDKSFLVPVELVTRNPRYISNTMARRLLTLSREEAERLEIPEQVVDAVSAYRPHAKPFSAP